MSESVVVAIPTFHRPARLGTLLAAVTSQLGGVASVLVVDNDPAESARGVAEGFGARYAVEPSRGLTAVRNRAIDECPDASALVFIDDDETPATEWLTRLVARWRASGVAAVSGRVVTRFPAGFDDAWIHAGGFFRRVAFADGQRQPVAATNNLLLDLGFVRAHGLRFDERFALSGGEDIMFTTQLVRAGGIIESCPNALVYDDVDPARLTRRWVLQRAYRVGLTSARVDMMAGGGASARARFAVKGLTRLGVGGLRLLLGEVVRSPRHSARGARAAYRGAGMLVGAFGGDYREYARR